VREVFVRKLLLVLLVGTLVNIGWAANSNDQSGASGVQTRLDNAANIIQEMTTAAPDKGIPQSVLDNAKCVAVVPNEIKGAFIVGGQRGSGFASCRTAHGWSAPAPFTMTGISWGPQIGGASRSLIMMVMNQQGMKNLMSGHFKVGAEVSAAAGPVGRQASANAGWKAGILTYSKSKGAFVGASLNGAGIQQDKTATKQLYGRDVSFQQILEGDVHTPVIARNFVNAVSNAKESASAR
jgi:lipid-binding SYLF domain-containing protein